MPDTAALARVKARATERPNGRSRAWLSRYAARYSLPVIFVAAVLALWQVEAEIGLVSTDDLPGFWSVVQYLGNQVTDGDFWGSLGLTVKAWALGLAISAVVGTVLGLIIGMSSFWERSTRGLVDFMRPIPSVALLPVTVLVFGLTTKAAVWLAAYASLWPILLSAIDGAREAQRTRHDVCAVFKLKLHVRFVYVILGCALPKLITSLRVSSAICLILIITVELVAGVQGLGLRMFRYQISGANTGMYAMVLVIGLLGYLLNHIFAAAEHAVRKNYGLRGSERA